MASALLRSDLQTFLGKNLAWTTRPLPETIPTGVRPLDAHIGGLPRGCLTEIAGPVSSGRTTLLHSLLARATSREEVCAVVDVAGSFDPVSAAAAGVELARLLWIRCGGNAEHALKAADLLVQGGGFGIVVMDLADMPVETARRISLTSWFRLRRAVEHTPTVLIAVGQQPLAPTCASLVLEIRRNKTSWTGAPGCSRLLCGLEIQALRRKPAQANPVTFEARAAR